MKKQLTLYLCGFALLAGCGKEPAPRTVTEFVDNPMLLEAAVVRCAQDRAKTKYEAECVNARLAVARVQAREEAAAKAALDARSESKMKAIRRNAAAAAEARRRAQEAERAREEAEYLAQFGVSPSSDSETADSGTGDVSVEGNLPVAVVPEAEAADAVAVDPDARPANDDGNAPVAELPSTDLDAVRDELRRRNEEGGN
ncbi:MAG: EexN family lipoprotein [Gammaproteobacteria bacterium]|nr:EexN family lipoprotein [Gammaproteobacteria bacterium]